MVNHTKLISSLTSSALPPNTKRWLSAYLKGRMANCRYNDTTSPFRHARTGVPQGSCISPVLFNYYVSSYPDSNLLSSSYADDFTDSSSHPHPSTAAEALSAHATRVGAWASDRGLAISTTKSTVTLFTPDFRESHLHPSVFLNNSTLPLVRNPRILGVTFDPHFTFTPHIKSIVSRAAPRLNILKALAGTKWGQQKETIIITFKSLIRSIFTYAAPIWFPNSSPSAIKQLQTIQNSALRIATGCVMMSSIDHLHAETSVLPVHNHLSLLCSQHLAKSLHPTHPSFNIVTSSSGPRSMKHTLQSCFAPLLTPHLSENIILNPKPVIKILHTEAVASAIASRAPNRVLESPPPDIAEEESSLPRAHRTALAQLRSGFCSSLNGYRETVRFTTDPLCPSCRRAPHTVHHLFSCRDHPTPLVVVDLWRRPGLVSDYTSSLPFFYLSPRPRPPPERPPNE